MGDKHILTVVANVSTDSLIESMTMALLRTHTKLFFLKNLFS